LRSIEILQHKSRMGRTLADLGHPTAFDIEAPHSLGVCLRLAGDARLVDARLSDMWIGDTVVANMGKAELLLRHDSVTSRIISDLTSPVRERRIELSFDGGHVVGYYPIGEDELYAHLRVAVDGLPRTEEIFADDALSTYLLEAYLGFGEHADFRDELRLGGQVVELITAAKQLCLVPDRSGVARVG